MSNIILAFILGFISGAIATFFYLKKIWEKVKKKLPEVDVSRETINAIVNGEEPKGDFIKINYVEEYIKTHDGEISLGDILEDENR